MGLDKEQQRNLWKVKIKAGCIIHIFCNFPSTPKNKFVVIGHIDYDEELILAFILNSRVHPLIENSPALKACQVMLKKADYDFLDHDSFLNCAEVYDELVPEEVLNHLLDKPSDYYEKLTEENIIEVIQAVHNAKTIIEYDRNLIIESLEDK